jgi:hypothetical protein
MHQYWNQLNAQFDRQFKRRKKQGKKHLKKISGKYDTRNAFHLHVKHIEKDFISADDALHAEAVVSAVGSKEDRAKRRRQLLHDLAIAKSKSDKVKRLHGPIAFVTRVKDAIAELLRSFKNASWYKQFSGAILAAVMAFAATNQEMIKAAFPQEGGGAMTACEVQTASGSGGIDCMMAPDPSSKRSVSDILATIVGNISFGVAKMSVKAASGAVKGVVAGATGDHNTEVIWFGFVAILSMGIYWWSRTASENRKQKMLDHSRTLLQEKKLQFRLDNPDVDDIIAYEYVADLLIRTLTGRLNTYTNIIHQNNKDLRKMKKPKWTTSKASAERYRTKEALIKKYQAIVITIRSDIDYLMGNLQRAFQDKYKLYKSLYRQLDNEKFLLGILRRDLIKEKKQNADTLKRTFELADQSINLASSTVSTIFKWTRTAVTASGKLAVGLAMAPATGGASLPMAIPIPLGK